MDFDRAGFDRDVGARMQLARKAQKMTQEDVAKRIGLTRPSYASIESGRQRIPIDVVWRVSVVLGVSISTLVPKPANRKGREGNVVRLPNPRRRAVPVHGADSDSAVGFSPAEYVARAYAASVDEDDG
jgi:transcriptional regulator with XRE-family HTH domain